MSETFTEEQLDRGRRKVRAAERQRANGVYSLFVSWALGQAAQGHDFAAQDWIEFMRSKDRVNDSGEPVKLNNDHAAIFVRWLIAEHPETARHVELRRSVFDVLIGGGHD